MFRRTMLTNFVKGITLGVSALLGLRSMTRESEQVTSITGKEIKPCYIPFLEYSTHKVRVCESQDGVTWTVRDLS